jgi:hypothetical protein
MSAQTSEILDNKNNSDDDISNLMNQTIKSICDNNAHIQNTLAKTNKTIDRIKEEIEDFFKRILEIPYFNYLTFVNTFKCIVRYEKIQEGFKAIINDPITDPDTVKRTELLNARLDKLLKDAKHHMILFA